MAAATRHGIAVSPAAALAVGAGHAPTSPAGPARLAPAAPPPDLLAAALDTLARLARGGQEDLDLG